MADAARRFQNPPRFKAKPLKRGIHRANDSRGGVVRVQRRGAGGFEFRFREQFFQTLTFHNPIAIAVIEDLRQAAPADVAHPNGVFADPLTPINSMPGF